VVRLKSYSFEVNNKSFRLNQWVHLIINVKRQNCWFRVLLQSTVPMSIIKIFLQPWLVNIKASTNRTKNGYFSVVDIKHLTCTSRHYVSTRAIQCWVLLKTLMEILIMVHGTAIETTIYTYTTYTCESRKAFWLSRTVSVLSSL